MDLLGNRYLELGRFSGSILVEEGGKIIYQNDFGRANYEFNQPFESNTAFKAGTLSQLFTRAILLKMVAEGSIILEEKVSEYLPEMRKEFSVEQLVNHQAGLPTIEAVAEKHPDVAYSAVIYANLSEEAEQQNSDLGYNLLGVLLEKVSGKTYSELINELSEEIQLKNTFFETPAGAEIARGYTYNYENNELKVEPAEEYELNRAYSSEGIKTTTTDLLKLLKFLPEGRIHVDGYLLNDGFSYALLKEGEKNIIVLSNRRHPVAGEIVTAIKAILEGQDYKLPLLRKEVKIDPALLEDYAGNYALNSNMQLQVVKSNDSLFVHMGPQKVHVKPQSSNQFFMEQGDSAIRFLRNSDGNVSAAELLDGFLKGTKINKVHQ